MRAIVIQPDNTWSIEYYENEYQGLRTVIGGYLEATPAGVPDITVWCDEEGKLKGLPFNKVATEFWWGTYGLTEDTAGDYLVGSIVITGSADRFGNSRDVPDWVATKLREE